MSDQSTAPQLCSQCRTPLGPRRVIITERDTGSSAVSDWTLCSWACARDLVVRFVRLGRDEHCEFGAGNGSAIDTSPQPSALLVVVSAPRFEGRDLR